MPRKQREMITPELTPLIDVVFLLLIFFMVTSVFKSDDVALLLKLPVAKTGKSEQAERKSLSLELTNKEVALNGEKIDYTAIAEKLKTFATDVQIQLRADESLQYKRLIDVLDILQLQNKQNISLITDQSAE